MKAAGTSSLRFRLVATLALFTFCGAGPKTAAPGVRVASGSGQSAQAYGASTEPGYVTTFPQALEIRVTGDAKAVGSVRYRCVERTCRFAVSTQPDDVKRIDPQTYEVRVRHMTASLRPTLSSDAPGTFTVEVRAVPSHGERAGTVARFVLTAR